LATKPEVLTSIFVSIPYKSEKMRILPTAAIFVFLVQHGVGALQVVDPAVRHHHGNHLTSNAKTPQSRIVQEFVSKSIASAALCTSAVLFWGGTTVPQVQAKPSPLDAALIEASDASYPVLKSLKSETVSPLANKIVNLFTNKVTPEKLTNLLEKGINAFLAIPDENLDSFTFTVKEAYTDVSTQSCNLVPLPTEAVVKFTSSEGYTNIDPTKAKAFREKFDNTFGAFPKTDNGICLPETETNLEKLFIAQTELSFAIPKNVVKEFGEAASVATKSIPSSDLLRLLPDIQKNRKGCRSKGS